jgi:Cu+-exporting ATPase
MQAMRRRLGLVATFVAVGFLAVAGAGCGGGHTFGRTSYSGHPGSSCDAMHGTGMAGMPVDGMSTPTVPTPAAAMPDMNVGGHATPTTAAAVPSATATSSAAAPTAAQPTAPAPQYVCPMHPDVVSPGPGSCPQCGMALQRR